MLYLIVGLAVLCIIVHGCTNYCVQRIAQVHYEHGEPGGAILDLPLLLLPDMTGYDVLSHAVVVAACAPVLFLRREALWEFVLMVCAILLVRGVTTMVTILPKQGDCEVPRDFSFFTGGCYDKIFSGHFAMVYLATLMYYKHGLTRSVPLLVGINLLNAIIILLTRHHYTIDIIMSFFVTSYLFVNRGIIPRIRTA